MVFFFNQIKSKNHFCHATQNRHDHAKLDQLTIGEMWLHAGMQGRIQLAFGPGQCHFIGHSQGCFFALSEGPAFVVGQGIIIIVAVVLLG